MGNVIDFKKAVELRLKYLDSVLEDSREVVSMVMDDIEYHEDMQYIMPDIDMVGEIHRLNKCLDVAKKEHNDTKNKLWYYKRLYHSL